MQQAITSGIFVIIGALISALTALFTTLLADHIKQKHEISQNLLNKQETLYLRIMRVLVNIEVSKDFHDFMEVQRVSDFVLENRDQIEFYASAEMRGKILRLMMDLGDLKDIGNTNPGLSHTVLKKCTEDIKGLKVRMRQEILKEKEHRLFIIFRKIRLSFCHHLEVKWKSK